MISLRYLVENDTLVICPPLTASRFVRFCSERGVAISEDRLERLEKLGLFYPMARVRHPKRKRKINYVNEGKQYQELGWLEENEKWAGDVMEEYLQFTFEREYALSWLSVGAALASFRAMGYIPR